MKLSVVLVLLLVLRNTTHGQNCSCTGGCDTSGATSSDGRKVNVAYGKSANISSQYPAAGPACVAVNGRTDTLYYPRDHPDVNCAHSYLDDYSPWWQVDLGQTYIVSNITIYRRKDYSKRMAGGMVYVDGQLCYGFPNSTDMAALDALPEMIHVTCNPPLTGQVVKFQRHGQGSWDSERLDYSINICEVQVWVCASGYYGADCLTRCGHCREDSTCNRDTGQCPRGCRTGFQGLRCDSCADGYHGRDCREQCGHCANNDVCDKHTGQCPHGCQTGYQPPDCKQSCTGNTYGENCTETCGSCQTSAPCDVTDGTCDVCLDQSHFVLPFCKECSDGWYGPLCDLLCINCDVTGSCDQSSGQCDHGCSAGWVVSATNFCDQECRFSTYGKGCQYRCGNCLHSKACRLDNGTCEEGCAEGYEGERCDKTAKLSDKPDNASLAGPIAGAIFGGLVVVAVAIFLGMWWFWSKRHNGGLNAANTGVTNPPSSPGGQGSASIGDLICSPVVTSHSSASHADAGNDEGEGHCYDIPNRARDNESNKYEYTTAVFKKGNEDSEHVYVSAGEDPDSKTNYEFV